MGKKVKNVEKQHPISQAFVVAIFGGLIAGIGSGSVISWFESKQINLQKEAEILFADEQNFGGACMFIRDIEKENEYVTNFKYVIDPYTTNADFVIQKSSLTRETIQKNIALMSASNILLDRFFSIDAEGLHYDNLTPEAQALFLRANKEGREALKKYAKQISDNIHVYNAELADLDCKQIIENRYFMSFVVIIKIGADEVLKPEVGFIPTLTLEEQDLPRTTVIPFHFGRDAVKETYKDAVAVAEGEAMRIINKRYPKGTKYRIER